MATLRWGAVGGGYMCVLDPPALAAQVTAEQYSLPTPPFRTYPPGDSRAVLCRHGAAERLTEDHKPNLAGER